MGLGRRELLGCVAGATLAPMPGRAQGPEYPDRPVRVIVPYAPGGTNDLVGRILSQKLSETLSQPFVVENRPGAQAIVGTEAVARARPDGYTLLIGASGPIVFNPATSERLSYDSLADFVPVTNLVTFPLVLLVSTGSAYRSLADLIDFAKANPSKANYGTPATSFQLATELFNQRAGTRFQHITYRGSADCVTALIRDEITMTMVDTAPAVAGLSGGQVRALAVTSPNRIAALPEVPTMKELGLPDVEAVLWTGMLAPARTPPEVVRRLNTAVAEALQAPDVKERLSKLVLDPAASTPEAFRATIAHEIELWRGVAKAANIQMDR
ncbi:tripartite tricarboxylate transporter substrate binding protein [Roseomonas sp. KE2513]|uniref:Bug family tripartite tricarboxylate transporter substrate binding protein n=1 Tax=Roseomonas sp. KE2513 TaxID=2479202 RepID=UPI0018DF6A6F|nr:tripartite tricarboxylate transporter substrate binding protein [Roseomonas sp. KE2513]MBI0538913.1 tripartite tricarboxylate transporter substrate binding protein [Roseomonas sp. KE2513]